MGDRYTITANASALGKRFNIDVPERYEPRYNAAPTQVLPVVTQGSEGLSFFYWGQLPERSKNKTISTKLIHAEKETLEEKVSLKKALSSSRCIIPADSFYAWKRISKKGRVPHRFIFGNDLTVSFAGIWEEFEDDEENVVHTFKIVTVPANSTVSDIISRMPAVLTPETEKIWLDPTSDTEALMEALETYPGDKMGSYTVSPRIDELSNEGAALIKPMAAADQFGNYSLFD